MSRADSKKTVRTLVNAALLAALAVPLLFSCSHSNGASPSKDASAPDVSASASVSPSADASPSDAPTESTSPTASTTGTTPPPRLDFCNIPGAIVFDATGKHVVPGNDADAALLDWLTLKSGFCARHYAKVPAARQLRFAPSGELFVASPKRPTAGGGLGGLNGIAIVADDNRDGIGDPPSIYTSVEATQGMLFMPSWFYYQDGTQIRRFPYRPGDRAPSAPSELVVDVTIYSSSTHWPKGIDVADDGTLYVSNGGDENRCVQPTNFEGGILVIDGTPGGRPIVKGLRNPMHIRCQRGHNHCFAIELARDFSAQQGGREKLLPIHEGDDWGHPCCATANLPYPDISPTPDCSKVTGEQNSFLIGDTPFGFDFAPSTWPKPWAGSVLVALHGSVGGWYGARVVAIATDPGTGMPLKSSTTDAMPSGAVDDFLTGWDDHMNDHGRPADVSFAPDGRMFVADDWLGEIFWVAPVSATTAPTGDP